MHRLYFRLVFVIICLFFPSLYSFHLHSLQPPTRKNNRLTNVPTSLALKMGIWSDIKNFFWGFLNQKDPRLRDNEKRLRRYNKKIPLIADMEKEYRKLNDSQLHLVTIQLQNNFHKGMKMDSLMIPAFAIVKETCRRYMNIIVNDDMLIAGMALHEGNIVDFPNKENRTMIHLFPAYLNTLTGRSVLVITHNDYMARKKGSVAELIFNVLGITSGVIQHYSSENQRKHAYNCNVTYLSHEELGLDFLRDNLAMNMDHIVQLHPFYYAIVTNADKVLIDDTKSPLSINRHSTGPMKKYTTSAKIAANLIRDRHYEVEKSKHYVKILPGGHIYAEKVLKKTLFDLADPWIMYVLNALRAKELYEKDEHYQVQDGKVKMLNTFTKKIEDKRFPDGIQQAIEAKEQVNITHEAVSLGRVSYQRIFRLFPRISGLTESTIEDDIEEYKDIYQMDTFDLVKPKIQPLPTSITPEELPQYERIQSNKLPDSLYLKKLTKEKMLLDYIVTSHQQKRPVMIGTDSYEYSLELQTLLSQRNLSSLVVSGKAESAERDYEILVQAARLNAITIITKQAAKGILIQPGGCLKSTLITIFKYMILMQMKSHVESIPELVPYRTILSELVQHTNGSFNSIAHYLHLSFTPLPLELENKLVEAIQTLDLHDIVSPYKLQRLISRISLYHSPIPSNIDALQNMYQECTQLYANEFETYRHEVLRLGGPILLATCRFTNRRWDKLWNIIGQPESPIITSKTFLSFQDELLQRYGAKKIQEFIHTYLIKEKEDIMMIFPDETNELINTVQRVAEDVAKVHRKRLHSLDEITSIQRSAIYSQRRAIVTSTKEGISDIFVKYTMQTLDELYRTHLLPQPTFNQTKAILAPTSANSISLGHTHSSSHHTHNHHNHSLPLRHHPSFTTEYNNSYHLVNITSLFVQLNQFFPGLLITYDDLQYVPHSLLLPLLKDRMIKSFEPLMHSIESATNNSFVHLVRQTILSKIDEKWSKQLMRLHLLEEEIMLLDLITEREVLEVYKGRAMALFTSIMDDVRRHVVYAIFNYLEDQVSIHASSISNISLPPVSSPSSPTSTPIPTTSSTNFNPLQ